jgi:hypothetical protein
VRHEQRFPMVNWMKDDTYRVSFIDNGRSLEFMFNTHDLGALVEKIGSTIKYELNQEATARRLAG